MKRIGPGPAKYLLPTTIGFRDHDYTFERMPMYSMGGRPKVFDFTVGPGSGKYDLRMQSRIGRKHVPAYIGRALEPITEKGVGPGPGKYLLPTMIGADRTRVWQEKSPDFVMGARLELKSAVVGPGPAKYLLPDTMGLQMKNIYANKMPMYSMRPQTNIKNYQVSPGPAKYDPRPDPKYEKRIFITMKGRHPEINGNKTPGPAKYDLKDYKPGKRSPTFSMGMALSGIAQPMIIPGDNC